jgi:hypothetical protein
VGCSALASCSCGYHSRLLAIGGGRTDFHYRCAFPAFCSEGRHLVTVNMFNKRRRCPDGHDAEPVPYDNEALVKKPGEHVVADWNVENLHLRLTDGCYLCPACLSPTLTFTKGHLTWD